MYIVVFNGQLQHIYTDIRNLRFSPQVSIVGVQAYADSMEVDVYTEDVIHVGVLIQLKDDFDNLYCSYRITSAEDNKNGVVHVIAKSSLARLEEKTCTALMCNNAPVDGLVALTTYGSGITIDIDPSIASMTINGYLPEQSARERITWLAFVTGGYITTSYSLNPRLLAMDNVQKVVQPNKTFWRPSLIYNDFVTAVEITKYEYIKNGVASEGDKTVIDQEGTEWIQRPSKIRMINNQIETDVPENVISIDGIGIITGNVLPTTLLSRMADYYFNRITVEADVINNSREFMTGQKLTVFLDKETSATGYCESLDYKFGLQTRTSLKLNTILMSQVGKLTINYVSGSSPTTGQVVAQETFMAPLYQTITIPTKWPDVTMENHRYIFRPHTDEFSWMLTSLSETVSVTVYNALIYNKNTKILKVISVDKVDYGYVDDQDVYPMAAVIAPSNVRERNG